MKRLVIICCSIMIISSVVFLIFYNHNDSLVQPATGSIAEISSEQISAHHQATDCWTAINGAVYDLSNYFNDHPSASLSNQLCGQVISRTTPLASNLSNIDLLTNQIGILSL